MTNAAIKRLRTELPRRLDHADEMWTQQQMATLLGVSRNYWAMLERGEREPSRLLLTALDFALRLAASGEDPSTTPPRPDEAPSKR